MQYLFVGDGGKTTENEVVHSILLLERLTVLC